MFVITQHSKVYLSPVLCVVGQAMLSSRSTTAYLPTLWRRSRRSTGARSVSLPTQAKTACCSCGARPSSTSPGCWVSLSVCLLFTDLTSLSNIFSSLTSRWRGICYRACSLGCSLYCCHVRLQRLRSSDIQFNICVCCMFVKLLTG